MCADSISKFRMIPIIGVAVTSGSGCFCGSLGVAVGSWSGCCGVLVMLLRGPGQVAAGSWSGCCGVLVRLLLPEFGYLQMNNYDASVTKYSPNIYKSIHLRLD